jgi:hypothetical protein
MTGTRRTQRRQRGQTVDDPTASGVGPPSHTRATRGKDAAPEEDRQPDARYVLVGLVPCLKLGVASGISRHRPT